MFPKIQWGLFPKMQVLQHLSRLASTNNPNELLSPLVWKHFLEENKLPGGGRQVDAASIFDAADLKPLRLCKLSTIHGLSGFGREGGSRDVIDLVLLLLSEVDR